ncbi:putative membrane protein YccC [Lysinibacillus sp. RC46]|uniref:hypothetical protein n=2 Tax=Lysinibacillus TaxID=400634 RepID=UPI0035126F5E
MENQEELEVVNTEGEQTPEQATNEPVEENVAENLEEQAKAQEGLDNDLETQKQEIAQIKAQLEKQLFDAQLKERGLEVFADINRLGELEGTDKLDYLQSVVDALLAKHSYKPLAMNGEAVDAVQEALSKGDVQTSIGHKFKNWFGK